MSFNRRRPDRPDRPDRSDRPQRRGGGDWQPRDRPSGDRGFQQRDRPAGDNRGFQPRGDRPFTPRPRFDRPPDEGAMSIRLDPRRLNALKHLAGEAGVRPGDLVRSWVEERLDAERTGAPGAPSLADQLAELGRRVAALESAAGSAAPTVSTETDAPSETEGGASPVEQPEAVATPEPPEDAVAPRRTRQTSRSVAASPRERVGLHDEMIAVLRERGPMSAGELALAVTERGRYRPPRSGKPIDAAMISQRVSNPTYRSRFTRNEGRIGLADESAAS